MLYMFGIELTIASTNEEHEFNWNSGPDNE